jgi:hypothetical protein
MTDRERAYSALFDLERGGSIASFIASQRDNGRWGFRVTMRDDSDYWFLPREVLAFAEGVKVGASRTREGAGG